MSKKNVFGTGDDTFSDTYAYRISGETISRPETECSWAHYAEALCPLSMTDAKIQQQKGN